VQVERWAIFLFIFILSPRFIFRRRKEKD